MEYGIEEEPRIAIPGMDWDSLEGNEFIVIYGRRGTGKSTTQLRIALELARRNKIDVSIGINPSETRSKPHMRRFCPPHLVFTKWDEEYLQSLMEFQKKSEEEGKMQRVLVMIDDILSERVKSVTGRGDVNFKNSAVFKELALRGRHMGIMVILNCHSLTELTQTVAKNVDIAICQFEEDYESRKGLHARYFKSKLPEYDVFENAFLSVTLPCAANKFNKGALVSHMKNRGFGLPSIFALKPIKPNDPIPQSWWLGRPIYWRLDQHFMPQDAVDESSANARDLLGLSEEQLACLGLEAQQQGGEDADDAAGAYGSCGSATRSPQDAEARAAEAANAAAMARAQALKFSTEGYRKKPSGGARRARRHMVRVLDDDDPR